MLSWLPQRRARIERLDTETEALIRNFGEGAYSEARRLVKTKPAPAKRSARDWGLCCIGGCTPDR